MSTPRPGLAAVPSAVRETYARYRPGTFSATVETIRLADGRSVRTDLIRLNPSLECYSLDLDGPAPRETAHYTVTPWAEAGELEARTRDVATILQASYPAVGLGELSDRVRDEGHPLGAGNLRAHEAIAATQAALWHVTNGVDLDTRPAAAPVAMAVHQEGHPEALPIPLERPTWVGTVARDRGVRLQLTLADRLQVGSYSVGFASRSRLDGVRVHLERSADGCSWTPVPSSAVSPGTDAQVHKVLGVGATLADGQGLGYAHYRVVITTDSPAQVRIGVEQVSLTPASAPAYPNPDRVVHLYHYLTARLGRPAAPGRELSVRVPGMDAAIPPAHVVGPILVRGVGPGQRFSLRALEPGAYVVDDAGDAVFRPVTSAEPVYLRLPRHRPPAAARIAVTLRGTDHLEPQLLLGACAPGALARFTPVVRLAATSRQTSATLVMDLAQEPRPIERVD